MDPFGGVQSFWDLSQQPNTFSTIPDDDFLAFLEKQFPSSVTGGGLTTFDGIPPPEVVDPQSLTRFPIPGNSPPSSDSSPSPPSANEHSPSRRQSGIFNTPGSSTAASASADQDDQGLKRKASDDSISGEPSHKSQHTSGGTSYIPRQTVLSFDAASAKKGTAAARRKSSGNPSQVGLISVAALSAS